MRRIPPFGAIEAFVVGSRTRSFRAAADELALSPSAFSRRIQLLETFVGTALFDRSGPAPVLTPAGARYLADLEPAIDTIRRGTDALRSRYRREPLRISTSLSVATTWLLPRLAAFSEEHDGIAISVSTAQRTEALQRGDVDVALYGDTSPPTGFPTDILFALVGVPLAAPQFVAEHGVADKITDLRRYRLLNMARPIDVWANWMAAVGQERLRPQVVTNYDSLVMMYEAAAAGLGVALGAPLAAERFLTEGRLVPCFGQSAPVGGSYYLAFADAAVRRRADAQAFTGWLKSESARSQHRFAGISTTVAPLR